VVKDDEAVKKYRGKTAVVWARYHGKFGLAYELQYLLVRYC
jgi:hypothetical protein